MSEFQKKLGWVWIATAMFSSTALADQVSALRRDLSQVQAPVSPGEMKMSQFRSGAGLTCELARKNLQHSQDSSSSAPAASADPSATRAL